MNLIGKSGLITLLVVIILSSCATHHSPTYLNPPQDSAGYILGSIGKNISGPFEAAYPGIGFYIRKVGTLETTRVWYSDNQGPAIWGYKDGDIQEENKRLDVFAFSMLPGDYEVFEVLFVGNDPYAHYQNIPLSKPISFSVSKNQTLYLGEFIGNGTEQKNLFGMTIEGGGFFTHSLDKKERDMAAWLTKEPPKSTYTRVDGRRVAEKEDKLTISSDMKVADFQQLSPPLIIKETREVY